MTIIISIRTYSFIALLSLINPVFAEAERDDYDLDNDGLIEINDLTDLNNLEPSWGPTTTLYGSSQGCPDDYCYGYELVSDLDFADADEPYNGHVPQTLALQTFEGNGFTLKNLHIASYENIGIFRSLFGSVIKNLVVDYGDTPVKGGFRVGGLAGDAQNSIIINCRILGEIHGDLEVGGFIGLAYDTVIINSHFDGIMRGGSETGGFFGISDSNTIYASSVTGEIHPLYESSYFIFGFVGNEHDTRVIASSAQLTFSHPDSSIFAHVGWVEASYGVAFDEESQASSIALINELSPDKSPASVQNPISETEIKCPTAADSSDCANQVLFPGWDRFVDESGKQIWDFGDNQTYPKIRADLTFSDSDSDGDGVIDLLDAFAQHPEAAYDIDGDGFPDQWNATCEEACQEQSDLILDADPPGRDPPQIYLPSEPTTSTGGGALPIHSVLLLLLGLIVTLPGLTRERRIDCSH